MSCYINDCLIITQALVAVLKSNLSKVKNGPKKIDRGEFIIEEAGTKRHIDLTKDWELCFLPGQKVLMSMVFSPQRPLGSACPSCGAACAGAIDEENVCATCGFTFQRIIEPAEDPQMWLNAVCLGFSVICEVPYGEDLVCYDCGSISKGDMNADTYNAPRSQAGFSIFRSPALKRLKRKREPDSDDDEIRSFRRVYIRSSAVLLDPMDLYDTEKAEMMLADFYKLYTARKQSDGQYHCPFEGKGICTHKPEILKTNYE